MGIYKKPDPVMNQHVYKNQGIFSLKKRGWGEI